MRSEAHPHLQILKKWKLAPQKPAPVCPAPCAPKSLGRDPQAHSHARRQPSRCEGGPKKLGGGKQPKKTPKKLTCLQSVNPRLWAWNLGHAGLQPSCLLIESFSQSERRSGQVCSTPLHLTRAAPVGQITTRGPAAGAYGPALEAGNCRRPRAGPLPAEGGKGQRRGPARPSPAWPSPALPCPA